MSAEPAPDEGNSAELEVVVGPLVGPVFSRVAGMMAARADFPVDRVDNVLLIADALAAHGPAQALDGRLRMSIVTARGSMRMSLGPLRPDGGAALLSQASIPGVGNVLEKAADAVSVAADPAGSGDVLVIEVSSQARAADLPGGGSG